LLAYLFFMSAVGGAVLARYMLPVVPLVVLAMVSTLWRRVRNWKLIVGAVAIAFIAGLFSNPPYGFSLEDNLAYRDYILLHVEASRFLAMRYPGERVLTAWPASDEITRPWLGYVTQPFRVLRLEDFSASQIEVAAKARGQFDVALVFSTKYQPSHPLFENWGAWDHAKRALDMGFMISFAGNVTFPKAQQIRDAAKEVPLDRMLIETDSPFLAPVPYRGKRNEPLFVKEAARQIGEIRGQSMEDIGFQTANNFYRFFSLHEKVNSI